MRNTGIGCGGLGNIVSVWERRRERWRSERRERDGGMVKREEGREK